MGARDSEEEAMYIMVGQIIYIYIYMLTPLPPRTNLSVFQNSKIPNFKKNPVNFFGNSKILKFQNSKRELTIGISKKLTGVFWNFGISKKN